MRFTGFGPVKVHPIKRIGSVAAVRVYRSSLGVQSDRWHLWTDSHLLELFVFPTPSSGNNTHARSFVR